MGFVYSGNYLDKMHFAFTVLFIVLVSHAVRTKQSSSVSDMSMTMSDMSAMPSASGDMSVTYSTQYSSVDMSSVSGMYPSHAMTGTNSEMWGSTETMSSMPQNTVSPGYSANPGDPMMSCMSGDPTMMSCMSYQSSMSNDPTMMSCMSYQSSMSSDPPMMSSMSYQSSMSSDPAMMSSMSYQSSMSNDPTMMSCMSYQSSMSSDPTMMSCMSYQSSMSSDPTMMSCMSYQSSMSSDPTMMSSMPYQSSMSSDPAMMSSMPYQSSMSSNPEMMSSMPYQSSMSSDPAMMSSMSYQGSMSSDPAMMPSMSYQSSMSSDPAMMSSMPYQSSMSSNPEMMSSMPYQSSMSSDPAMMSSMSYQSSMSSDPAMMSSMPYQSSMSSDPAMMSSMPYQSSMSSDPAMMSSMPYHSSMSSNPAMMSSMPYQSSMSSDPAMMSSMPYQSSMSSDPAMMSSMPYQSSMSSDPAMMSSMPYQNSMSSNPAMMSSMPYHSSMSSDPAMMSSMPYHSSMSSDPAMMSSMPYQNSMSSNPAMMSSMPHQSSMSSDPAMMSSMPHQSSMSSDPAMMSSMPHQSSMSSDPAMMSSMPYQSSMSSDPAMMSSMPYQSSMSSDPAMMSSMPYQNSMSSDPAMMSSMPYHSSMSSDPAMMSSMPYQSSMSSDPAMMSSMPYQSSMTSDPAMMSSMLYQSSMSSDPAMMSSMPYQNSMSSDPAMMSSMLYHSSMSSDPAMMSSMPYQNSMSSDPAMMSSMPYHSSMSSDPAVMSSMPYQSSMSSNPEMMSSMPYQSSMSSNPAMMSSMSSSSIMSSYSSMMTDTSSTPPLSSSSPMDSSSSMMQMTSSSPAASTSSTPQVSSSSPMDSSSSMMQMTSSSPAASTSSTPQVSSSSPMDSSSSMMQMTSSSPAASTSSTPQVSSSSPMDSSSSMMQMTSSSPAPSSSSTPPVSSSSPVDSSSSVMQMSSSSPAASSSSSSPTSSPSPMDSSSSMVQMSSSSPATSTSSTPQVSSSPAAGSSSTSPVSSSLSSAIAPSSFGASATLTTSTEIMPSTTMTTPTSTLADTSTSVAITPSSVSSSVAPSSSVVIDFSGFYGCFQQRGINFLANYEVYNKVYCAASRITAIGDKLANLTLPDGNVTTIDLTTASSSVLATVSPSPLSASGPNCSAYDFTGQTEAEILSNLQKDVQSSITFFTSQASTEVDQAAQCGVNVLGSQASTYTSAIDTYKTNAKAQNAEFKAYFEALLAALKEVTGCTGTLDCAGQCNGAALFHAKCKICYGGTANVSAITDFLDCNDECNGNATTNNCGECYGGSTGRNITYGVDNCNGQCTGRPGYVSSTDCNNECNGTAFVDSCSGQCVGGSTGKSAADFRDCNNNCNGTSVNDTCGFCVAASSAAGVTGSLYKDCNNDCYTPGTLSQMASNNTCMICVGGRTGKPATEGMDACGVCDGDNSTCTDCSGVPNGGKVLDACGVCNGDGTSCLAVTSVSLDYVPAQTARTVKVGGAGLNGATLECVAINQATNAETSVTITQKTAQEVTISLPALTAATYKISCRQGPGQALANSTVTVTAYASSATVTSVTPTQFTISGSTQTLAIVGSGFVVNHTYCHVKVGAAAETTFLATVTDSSNAACDVTHPTTSSQILVALSLNKVDKLASDTTVTAQAAAPTATAAFSNSGEKVVVTFSAAVATASLSSCAAVFQDVSSLGTSATCTFQSRTVMLIESTTAAIDSTLTLKTGAVKAFGETHAIAASGTITLAKGSNPVKPTGNIRGPSQLGTCSDLSVDALRSTGGGGRALSYTWAVSPATGLTLTGQGTASLSVTGTMSGSTYTVTLSVCNFMNECDNTPTLTVQKLATAIPDVFVKAGVDTTNVLVSESFELTADAKLTSCVDDTLLFSWSFSHSNVNINNVDVTRRIYNVRSGDLPGDVTVTATVTVSLASDTTRSVTATIALITKSTPLVASIKGSDTVTIGTQTGQLSLDGSGSRDPDGAPGSLKYEWSCVEQLASSTATCLDPTGATFPTAAERTTATLTMATSRLSGGKTYVFTLTVSKSSGSNTRSGSASVTVITIEGTPPKVLFRDLPGGDKINRDNIFTVTAIIESSTTVTASWESVVTDGFGFVDLTNANNLENPSTVTASDSASYVTVLSVKAGILQRGTNYRFKATVTDTNGKSSVATKDVYVYNGVTSCSLSAPSSYQELDPVTLSVSKCSTDSDGIPLTFTLYKVAGGSDTSVPLSITQDSGQFTVSVGPKADGSGKNVFAVEVCANKGGCAVYRTGDITVTAASSTALAAKQTSVISNVETLKKEGNSLQAAISLSIYIAALQRSTSRRRRSVDEALDRHRRSTVVTTDLARLQIELVNTTLNNRQLKETDANTLLGILGVLPASTVSDSDMLVVTSYYLTITNYFQTNSIKMQADGVQYIQTWTAALAARSITGSDVTDLTSKITLASRLGYQLDQSQTFIFAQSTRKYMFVIPGSGHVSKDTNGATINFGDTLRKRFASWSCSSGTCEGVGIEITTSNTDVDPYSTNSDDINRRSSDVLDILFIDPSSGVALASITGLSVPVTITFVVTRPQSGSVQSCKYWNTLSGRWETDGLSVSSQSTSKVICTTDHLTGFATFGEPTTAASTNQTGLIVGIVFGGIIAMCVIIGVAIIIALAVNKKNKVNIVEAISPPLRPEP